MAGSLSGAARALGVQQHTMGRRLEVLEQRAEAKLLHKTPGGYVLTEAGEAVPNRALKLLEGTNIKLFGVASDVFGVSGMAMLEALAAGTNDVSEMADLARGRMRRKRAALEAALEGRMREHQCFLLGMQLRTLQAIGRDLDALDARIEAQLEPFQAQHRLLMQIPGVD